MKAIVDRDACISCGLCPDTAPEVFEMDDEDIAVVKADPVPADAEDSAREAAEQCPSDAIAIEE
jgi:ferredoxin